jgi:peptidoglycan/LPS O-acetylase OafA/YrhL
MVDTGAVPEAGVDVVDGGPPPHHDVSRPAVVRPRHFPCFDGLRAIAALLVVLVHTSFASGFTLRGRDGIYTARLEIGVAVFFLISGFLLYRPFAASHIAGGPSPAVGKFWVRRFLRIIPAYWLAFFVTSYVMHVNKVKPGWQALLVYLGLGQVYLPSQVVTGITQAWSLCTEVAFYLLMPLYAMAIVARRRSDRHQLDLELAGLGILFVTGLVVRFVLLDLHTSLGYVAISWLPACLDLFALGMLLAVLSSWFAHRNSEPRWLSHPAMPWVSWACALGCFWLVAHVGISRLPLVHAPPDKGVAEEILYGLFAFFLLLPAVFGPVRRGVIRRVLACWPVSAVGVVSYGVYLWHQAWIDLFLRWTNLLFKIAWWKMLLPVLALSIATAAISYFAVERPALKLKNRLSWWTGVPREGADRSTLPVSARDRGGVVEVLAE